MYLNCSGQIVVSRALTDEEEEYILSELDYCPAVEINSIGRRDEIGIWDSGGCDVGDSLEAINTYLNNRRISIVPDQTRIRYSGDYEGGYVYVYGRFCSCDIEDYIIQTTPTERRVEELRHRGMQVTVSGK